MSIHQNKSVTVSAAIDPTRVTIFGYTSPLTRVELTSPRVFAATYSNDTGLFTFDKTLIPRPSGELCLTAIDDNSRHTPPLCFPPPPITNYHTDLGPFILPPTLTIADNSASGQSIPNSPLQIHFYQTHSKAPIVNAFSLPTLQTTTDSHGNFDLNLISTYSTDYRLYATTLFADSPSPKSNTLAYSLPGQFNYLILLIPFFFLFVLVFCSLFFFHKRIRYLPVAFSFPLALSKPLRPSGFDKSNPYN